MCYRSVTPTGTTAQWPCNPGYPYQAVSCILQFQESALGRKQAAQAERAAQPAASGGRARVPAAQRFHAGAQDHAFADGDWDDDDAEAQHIEHARVSNTGRRAQRYLAGLGAEPLAPDAAALPLAAAAAANAPAAQLGAGPPAPGIGAGALAGAQLDAVPISPPAAHEGAPAHSADAPAAAVAEHSAVPAAPVAPAASEGSLAHAAAGHRAVRASSADVKPACDLSGVMGALDALADMPPQAQLDAEAPLGPRLGVIDLCDSD